MNRSTLKSSSVLAALLAGFSAFAVQPVAEKPVPGKLPLYFEANRGQASGEVEFLSHGSGCDLFITRNEAVMTLTRFEPRDGSPREGQVSRRKVAESRTVSLRFEGANEFAGVSGAGELPGRVNYLIGRDASQWRAGVSTFTQVRVGQIYPGVDAVFYGNQRRFEYDLIVAPEADASVISIRVNGTDKISVDAHGELVLKLGENEIRQPRPVAYQLDNGVRKNISVGYRLTGRDTFSFEIGKFDRTLPLVIDPVLTYSSFFGSTGGDTAWDLAIDADGFIYVAGETTSAALPTTPGAFRTNYQGGTSVAGDAFVAKFDNSASNLVYLTYLGGSTDDGALGIAVDAGGRAFVTGYTDSTNFPVLPLATAGQTNIGGIYDTRFSLHPVDAFVTVLNTNGSGIELSTFLGGSAVDEGFGIAVDAAGDAFVTGFTESTNFPAVSAQQPASGGGADAFVAKILPDGSFGYVTSLGGTNSEHGESIAVDAAGNATVVGFTTSTNFPLNHPVQSKLNPGTTNATTRFDTFIAKYSPSGSNTFSTFFGGVADEIAMRVALDAAGDTFITGWTGSTNFDTLHATTNFQTFVSPTNSGADVFVTKFDASGTNIVFTSVFGGRLADQGWDIAVDAAGNSFITGYTDSTNFPVAGLDTNSLLRATNSGSRDAFIAELNATGTALVYSAYLGGKGSDAAHAIEIDSAGNAYIVGGTASTNNFPLVSPRQAASGGGDDAFIAKISPPPSLRVTIVNGKIRLAWRAFSPEYRLESQPAAGGVWSPVAQPSVLLNGMHTVTVDPGAGAPLFRLRKQ